MTQRGRRKRKTFAREYIVAYHVVLSQSEKNNERSKPNNGIVPRTST